MQLRVCDCRNAKFQGQTVAKEPQGFGLALDDNYSIILSEWDKGSIGWPFLTIFGNSTKVYGDLINQSECLLVYSTREYKIFKNNSRIVVDFFLSQTMVLVSGHSSKGSSIKNWAQDKKQKLIIIEEIKYTSTNYLNKLQYLLQIQVPSKYLSYQNFLKQTFRTTHRDLISLSESSKEVSFSFMNEGIFAKLDKKSECLVSLGSTGPDRKIQICRRYSYCRDYSQITIEESITTKPSMLIEFQIKDTSCQTDYTFKQQGLTDSTSKHLNIKRNQCENQQEGRPIECIKNIRQYYKRSLTFTNKYLNLSRAYEIRDLFESIYLMFRSSGNRNYGQMQLENSGAHIFHHITQQKVFSHSQATIQDWKKQITRAMGSKQKNRGDTSMITSPLHDSPQSPYSRIKNNRNNLSGSQQENTSQEIIKTPSRRVGIRRRQTAISFNPASNQPFQQLQSQPLVQPQSKLKSKPNSQSNQKSRLLWQSQIQIDTKFSSKSQHNFDAHQKQKSKLKLESDIKSLSQCQPKSKVECQKKSSSKLKKQPQKSKQKAERSKSKSKIIYTQYQSLESITKCLNGMNGEHKNPNFVKFKYVDD